MIQRIEEFVVILIMDKYSQTRGKVMSNELR